MEQARRRTYWSYRRWSWSLTLRKVGLITRQQVEPMACAGCEFRPEPIDPRLTHCLHLPTPVPLRTSDPSPTKILVNVNGKHHSFVLELPDLWGMAPNDRCVGRESRRERKPLASMGGYMPSCLFLWQGLDPGVALPYGVVRFNVGSQSTGGKVERTRGRGTVEIFNEPGLPHRRAGIEAKAIPVWRGIVHFFCIDDPFPVGKLAPGVGVGRGRGPVGERKVRKMRRARDRLGS